MNFLAQVCAGMAAIALLCGPAFTSPAALICGLAALAALLWLRLRRAS